MSCTKPIIVPNPTKPTSLKDLINKYKKTLKPKCVQEKTLYDDLNEVLALKGNCSQEAFLRRCVCNRKRHQWCLANIAVDGVVKKLLANLSVTSSAFPNFEKLYDTIYDIIGQGSTGISYCTVYDTSARFGWSLSPQIVPVNYVYVHQKLIQSARHILGKNTKLINHCRIERVRFDKLEPAFKQLNALEFEDFLCVCHDDIMNLP